MSVDESAVHIANLTYRYGPRIAIDNVCLDVRRGEILALLGPNGSGKSTMFRVLSTLVPIQTGRVSIFGLDLALDVQQIRERIGVVFQSPSVDLKLSVWENLAQQAALYGLARPIFHQRGAELLDQLSLTDRKHERVQTLSGGLRRRVELAKGMLHVPQLLLMDEPSTGLDPGARNEVWQYLLRLKEDFGVTVAMTTHLLDEAEKADRVAILDQGKLVALDAPDALRARLSGDVLIIETKQAIELVDRIQQKFGLTAQVVDNAVRLEQPNGHAWVPKMIEAFPGSIDAIRVGRPTLEDVFVQLTGRVFWDSAMADSASPTTVKGETRGRK